MRKLTARRIVSMVLTMLVMLGAMPLSAQAYDTAKFSSPGHSLSTTAFIDEDDNLWVWDVNPGNGTDYSKTPVKILDNVVSFSRGGKDISAAIKLDGSLWMWGDNSSGQLGDGTTKDSLVPKKVMDNVAAVSCSLDGDYGFTAAIKKDGSLWTWGCANSGRLGNGKRVYDTSFLPPQKIMTGVRAVSCGEGHAAVIKNDGSLWTWGINNNEQLGYIGPNSEGVPDAGRFIIQYEAEPKKVMDNVACVSCGYDFTAVVKTDGSLWTFGNNRYGKLGIGDIDSASESFYKKHTPKKIMDDVRVVSCGRLHMAIVKNDGSLWTCGNNEYGILGNGKHVFLNYDGEILSGDGTDVTTPAKVFDDAVDVSCEFSGSIALKKDGSYWTWGNNIDGELGYPDGNKAYTRAGIRLYMQTVPRQPEYPFTPKTPKKTISIDDFSDVYIEDYFVDSVRWAVQNNITAGVGGGRFAPGDACKREQIVTFLYRSKGSPAVSITDRFADMPKSEEFQRAISWAVESGITMGNGKGKFNTGMGCTRAEAVTFLWRAAGKPVPSRTYSFSDMPENPDFKTAISWAVENDITQGTGGNKFSPGRTCTRGEIVTFLYRAR